ncbi:hypothetical protein A4X13_0g7031, partial [Tilletia indica]
MSSRQHSSQTPTVASQDEEMTLPETFLTPGIKTTSMST